MKSAHEQKLVRAMIAVAFFVYGGATGEAWLAYRLAHEARAMESGHNDGTPQTQVNQPAQPIGFILQDPARNET